MLEISQLDFTSLMLLSEIICQVTRGTSLKTFFKITAEQSYFPMPGAFAVNRMLQQEELHFKYEGKYAGFIR